MAVSPISASIGITFGQGRELIARRWVVVAVVVLLLVGLGQESLSTTSDQTDGGDSQLAQWATTQYRLWFPIVAACFAALGGSAFVLATDRVAARVFLGFATAAAAALLAAIATTNGQAWAIETEYVALAAVGASAPLLFLVFPINRLASGAARRLMTVCISVHVALVAVSCGLLILQEWPLFPALTAVLLTVLAADLLIAIGLAVGVLVVAPPCGGPERRLLRLVALGMIAGLAPFPMFVLAPRLTSDNYLLAPWMAVIGLVVLPASLGAAILSRQFLGIERIVRRGVIALLVWMALLGVYGVIVDQFGDRVGAWSEDPPAGWLLIVVAGVAGTFPVVESRLRRAAEHRLFRDVYDYRDTLQQLGFEIVNLKTVQQIAVHVLARLGRTLDLSWAVITINDESECGHHYCWGKCPPDQAMLVAQSALVTPLVADGATIGNLMVGPKRHDIDLLAEDLSLIGTLAHLLATAFENALLVKRLGAQVATLADRQSALEALSEKLMRVQEEERRKLALDIHDDPLQRAILLSRRMGAVDNRPDSVWVTRQVEDIIASLRALCSGLRPAELDHLGLVAGLEVLVQSVRAATDLDVSLHVDGRDDHLEVNVPPDLGCALYRVAQEALNNCLKHAGGSRVEVMLSQIGKTITLRVADNGRGFGALNGEPGRPRLGVLGMRERLRPWGGVVRIASGPAGGTVVSAEVSLASRGLPQLVARTPRAFGERLELGPDNAGMHAWVRAGGRAEAAIGARDNILAVDHTCVADDPLGHHVRVLDEVRQGVDNTRNE